MESIRNDDAFSENVNKVEPTRPEPGPAVARGADLRDGARVIKKAKHTGGELERRTRLRLNSSQIALLELEYERDARWDRALISRLANRLNVSFKKVYKWHWERARKHFS